MDALDATGAMVRERDLDRYLATQYAPAPVRAGLMALHALDLELAEVVRSTTEPMLGQIRLAWWREQLQALDGGARPAQPTLAALAEHVLPAGISGTGLEPLEDAGLALLEDDIAAYSEARAVLFEAAVRLLAPSAGDAVVATARRIGHGWVIVDVARTGRVVATELLDAAECLLTPSIASVAVRPLLALAPLARRDLAALKAGRRPEARGTPGRQLRLLWSIVSGQ